MAFRLSTGLLDGLLDTDSMKTLFENGVIYIYSGGQPVDADSAETGTKLMEITVGGEAFTPGAPGNGLEFETAAADGKLEKASGETWQGVGLVAADAGWFRFFDNNRTMGDSTTSVRFDGTCRTSGGDMTMSSTTIAVGATNTIDTFSITVPTL